MNPKLCLFGHWKEMENEIINCVRKQDISEEDPVTICTSRGFAPQQLNARLPGVKTFTIRMELI